MRCYELNLEGDNYPRCKTGRKCRNVREWVETVKTNEEGSLSSSGELNRQCLQKKKSIEEEIKPMWNFASYLHLRYCSSSFLGEK